MYGSMFKLLAVLFFICIVRGNAVSNGNDKNTDSNELDFKGRIFGGKTDKPCDPKYSYVARLFVTFGYGQSVTVCSGTVISEMEILTAAHCLNNNGMKASHVWAQVDGSNYFIGADDIFVHPNYSDLSHDIGLIKLHIDTFFIDEELPLLPRGLQSYNRRKAVIAGWGLTSDSIGSTFSSEVNYANVTLIPDSICEMYFPEPNMLCTLGQQKTCAGDSGGPLIFNINKRTYIIGVTAAGPINCNSDIEPSGYTAVEPYIPWITSIRSD